MVSRPKGKSMENKSINVNTNDKTDNKMNTHKSYTNDPEEPTPITHTTKFKDSNMVREWLKKLKTKKKLKKMEWKRYEIKNFKFIYL